MLFRGMLVELPGHMGVGKLDAVADGRCTVTVFYSILRSATTEMSLDDLARAYLSPQTRVYVRDEERFRVGRVTNYLPKDNGLIDYEIRFPNNQKRDISELDLYVRPWNAPEDPAEILAGGGAESQFLHDRRQAAVMPLVSLRAAAQGMTSLISAGVEFVPHQIAAVRRVLTDPIQRYLLADEVGLGKTIEAGLIIRQHLVDRSDAKVLISTPAHLLDQWRQEMLDKLRLDQFGDSFECCSHEELYKRTRTPDILVIDEAHHLVAVDSGPLLRSAECLRPLAGDTPVLLLLSATPPLGEEARFLALLNLLDPVTHPLGDVAAFRTKLEQRRELGRLLLGLDPKAPGLVTRQRGAELQRLFPDDQVVQNLAPRLMAATREAPQDVIGLCAALKEHVADSYRIHQRLIRSRRADAKGWEFMPRGPAVEGEPKLAHVRTEAPNVGELGSLLATLEDWRFAAFEAAVGDDVALSHATTRYAALLGAAGLGSQALNDWLDGADETFSGESEILDALRSSAPKRDDELRVQIMVESASRLIKAIRVDRPYPKVVIFASTRNLATLFRDRVGAWDELPPAYLLVEGDLVDSAAILDAFKESRKSGLLITDRSGEEGLNLSVADAIVHLDLPVSAARLEQRIGRLDRFGRRQSVIRHRILLPSDEGPSPWAAWFELLANGFMIFNRSISDVQFLLSDLEAHAFRTLLETGPDGLVDLVPVIRARIEDERKSQDEQYALDRIAIAEEPVEAFIQGLEDAEEDEDAIERGVDQWLISALLLKKRPYAWPKEDPFKLIAVPETLIPRLPWQSELEVDCVRPLTWKRSTAMRRPEAVLLRPGAPLIDVVERYTRWDDRGTAFITYRIAPDWDGEFWLGFKLCFVIEPCLELADLLAPTPRELAILRRAQRYFAPRAHTLYIDMNGEAVQDTDLIAILERSYQNKGEGAYPPDINLGSRPKTFASLIAPSAFQQICRSVRDLGRAALATEAVLADQIAAGTALAGSDIRRRGDRLERRQSAGDALAQAEIGLIREILPSIREPAIRLDAMGCFVVAQRPPERCGDE